MKFLITFLSILFLTFISLIYPLKISEEDNIKEEVLIVPTKTKEEILLESMTTEEKVGQLFIFGFDGTVLTPTNKQFLIDHHIGGVLLLSKNITNEQQLKNLTAEIQRDTKIPLFISIDQEGGTVSRIKWGEVLTESQSGIDTPLEAYSVSKSRGEILKEYGINMNLAPVIEYITEKNSFIYKRVYRGTQEEVIEKSINSINGYKDAGIISVPKHYPGHSNSSPDSHYSLPIVNIPNEQWEDYTKPFSVVLEESKPDAVMVGHIKYPNIDSNPSTISNEIVNNRLRKDLEFNGLVLSDDMEMDALDGLGTHQEIAVMALQSGIDLLIYSKYAESTPTIQKDVYEYVLQQVKDGYINIDEKVLRILKTKIQYGIIN